MPRGGRRTVSGPGAGGQPGPRAAPARPPTPPAPRPTTARSVPAIADALAAGGPPPYGFAAAAAGVAALAAGDHAGGDRELRPEVVRFGGRRPAPLADPVVAPEHDQAGGPVGLAVAAGGAAQGWPGHSVRFSQPGATPRHRRM